MKTSVRCLLIALVFVACTLPISDATADAGFYLSNSTHLLYLESTSVSATHVLYAEPQGRIVSVAPDIRNGYLFWSDISSSRRAIYRGTLNGQQMLSDVTKLTDDGDVIEVNGLSVDWISRHVYWTDARKRTLNVVDYEGHNKRILGVSGLLIPRAVYADPIGGYLYWGDQGSRRIERSRLDGSGRQVIASVDVIWPNEIQVHDFKLYWVDAWTKSLMRSNPDGSDVSRVTTIATAGDSIMFGLTFRATSAFISVWQKGEVLQLDLEHPARVTSVFTDLGTDALFGLAYVDSNLQPSGDNPCGRDDRGGCSHLCLPTDVIGYRCSCPSFGGLALTSDTKSCREPSNLLFYTLGDWGQVGFIDLNGAQSPDLNLVGTSLRPVAVTYDPVEQQVYWSDVHERTVHRAHLDGSGHEVFLSYNHSLGIVDGLAFDVIHRQLYYTNVGQVAYADVSYSWHKVELIGADGTGRRVIYSGGEKPRGVLLDLPNARVYHTDWGSQAGVWMNNLDGSHPQQTAANMDNPNGIARMGTRLFVIDSHAKTRDPANPNYPGPSRNGTLYSCQGGCESFSEMAGAGLLTPFSISADDSRVYVADWGRKSILKISMRGNDIDDVTELLSNVPTPMGVFFSERSVAPSTDVQCENRGCEEACISESPTEGVCVCDSYETNVLADDETSCNAPAEFYLVADMNGIRLRGVETVDSTVYTIVQGSSYFSNFPSLTFDPSSSTIYFSDVARRRIYRAHLDGTGSGLFYQTPHVIDGLVFDSGFLYWTDYLTGVIARIRTDGSAVLVHEDIILGLSQPRAIRVDSENSFIYWTEWGRNPRVARANLADGSGITTLVDGVLIQPNGLALHGDKLYVGDAGNSSVWECSLDGENCKLLNYMNGVAHNIYDLQRLEDWLIYSDWGDHKVKVVSMVTGQESVVMEGLMRPSQFYLHVTSASDCPAQHACPEACMAYPGGYQCRCGAHRKLDSDGVTCIEVPGGWEATPCPSGFSCSEFAQCAREAGTLNVQCQCMHGYDDNGDGTCTACTPGTFKPYLGPARCVSCPAMSNSTLPASTACDCEEGLVWDWTMLVCQGHKPGACPHGVPVHSEPRSLCASSCSNDLDCPSVQKCCENPCPVKQCIDPVGLDQCVYEAHAYQIGESFSPDACTHCECLSRKPPGQDFGQATCHQQTCPTLVCGQHAWIQDPGVCCPRCPSSPEEQVLEILNCPVDPVHINTDPDEAYVLYDPGLQVRDNLYLSRDITLTTTPNVTRFWWLGQGSRFYQNVSVAASARAPTGDYDTAFCNYSVYVRDMTPPHLTCPEDIHIYTSAINALTVWPDPLASDNVGLLGLPVTDTSIPGVFDIGRHPVTYTVLDTAGNPGRCTMYVTITNTELECPPPPTLPHGHLDCDEFDGCYLDCHEGYTRNSLLDVASAYDCEAGQWQPRFGDHFSIEACIRVRTERWWGSGNVEFLPSVGESAEVDVEAGFREYIQREYLHALHLEPLVHIQVSSQDISQRKKRESHQKFTISFKFEGPDNFTSVLIGNDFRSVLTSMREAVDQSRFKVVGNGETLTARRYSLRYEPPHKQCGPGEQAVEAGCLVCMIGTYFNNVTCVLCPEDTYNGVEGQTTCSPCPYGKYASPGSYSPYQCKPSVGGATVGGVSVSIIAGTCAGVVAVIIIIIVIFGLAKVTRRLLKKTSGLEGAVQFDNMAFAEEDPYAELPVDKMDM